MASFRGASDLVTELQSNINMANVTAFTNRPIIRLKGGSDATGDSDSGELVMEHERYGETRLGYSLRDERYVIRANYTLGGQSAETNFKEVMEEIKRHLESINGNQTSEYDLYEMDYEWNTNLSVPKGVIVFTLHKFMVSG